MKPADPWRFSRLELVSLMLTSAFCVVAAVALGLGPDWIDVAKISSSMGQVSLTFVLIARVSRVERAAKTEIAKAVAKSEQLARGIEGLVIIGELLTTYVDLVGVPVEKPQRSRGAPEDIQDAEVIG